MRVLAIDDTPAILADYEKIFSRGTGVRSDPDGRQLDAMEAALFGPEAGAVDAPAEADAVRVSVAGSGRDGLRLVEAAVRAGTPFDVAFVDMRMPGGWDGIETIRHLFAADPGLQVVVATAFSDRSLGEVGRSFRRNDQLLILKKPFDAVEVRQAAAALAAKRRMTKAAAERVEELDAKVAARTEQIRRMSLQDALTGLPNRQALLERLGVLVEEERARREAAGAGSPRGETADGRGFALLFLDFNRFKLINDSLGHAVGDRLLLSITRRIHALERSFQAGAAEAAAGCTMPIGGPLTGYRLGGDEFVLLLERVPCLGAASEVALAAIDLFAEPHELRPHACVSTASIGLATSFREHLDAGELLRDSDLAMFAAKAQGRETGRPACVAYEGAMHAAAQRRLTLENDLRTALDGSALDLRYQPILDSGDGRTVGVEALLAWTHPRLGRIGNAEILGVAEEAGLINDLGRWVRRSALEAAGAIARAPGIAGAPPVHVNVSRRELLSPGFAAGVQIEAQEAGLPLHRLVLEVSEVGIDRQSEPVSVAIRELHAAGLAVVLDDFGRERSPLAFLAGLPLRAVKIDRFFISGLGGDTARFQVLQAIIGFARAMGLATLACGVETPEQLAGVQGIGLDHVQGNLTGPPVTLEELCSGPEALTRRSAAA
ncbi:putative response regulator receiver protein [Phycisphaera mikurensis NBRC 102666]|uniref:Putative response regulator receiver protein n=1 Tax=Phycisphaera mikurensis (strain NBRC 102666 / KCTC 22515 / FYK2301M01) TaxID=1142394 RepID=I0IEX4_PHYMF|nr:putative response regulator receiver protein [Phycisphaera mikurensis NBRC 102666]